MIRASIVILYIWNSIERRFVAEKYYQVNNPASHWNNPNKFNLKQEQIKICVKCDGHLESKVSFDL